MDWAILILRLGLGIIFTAHGLQKVLGLFGGSGITGFSKMLGGLGFLPVLFWAYLAAYVELIAGLSVIAGLFVRTASFLLLVVMAVAVLKVHLKKGFFLAVLFNVFCVGFEYNTKFEKEYYIPFSYTLLMYILYINK